MWTVLHGLCKLFFCFFFPFVDLWNNCGLEELTGPFNDVTFHSSTLAAVKHLGEVQLIRQAGLWTVALHPWRKGEKPYNRITQALKILIPH